MRDGILFCIFNFSINLIGFYFIFYFEMDGEGREGGTLRTYDGLPAGGMEGKRVLPQSKEGSLP